MLRRRGALELPDAGLREITDADVEAYLQTRRESSDDARQLALDGLVRLNPGLATRLVRELQESSQDDPYLLLGIIITHACNAALENGLSGPDRAH